MRSSSGPAGLSDTSTLPSHRLVVPEAIPPRSSTVYRNVPSRERLGTSGTYDACADDDHGLGTGRPAHRGHPVVPLCRHSRIVARVLGPHGN